MAILNVVFKDGDGSLSVKVYRAGKVVKTATLLQTGNIELDAQKGDMISLGGVCTGTADTTIDVQTVPTNPIHDDEGPINHSLRVK